MQDKSHIRFVDAHAKGDGGNNNIDALHQEVVLRLGAHGNVEPGMVGRSLDAIDGKHQRKFFHLLAA